MCVSEFTRVPQPVARDARLGAHQPFQVGEAEADEVGEREEQHPELESNRARVLEQLALVLAARATLRTLIQAEVDELALQGRQREVHVLASVHGGDLGGERGARVGLVPGPAVARSIIKPRMTPSNFAQTTAISAIGALEIHILDPLR